MPAALAGPFCSPTCRELLCDHFPQLPIEQLSDAECEHVFARLWTQCEALLKASGEGLNNRGIPAACCSIEVEERCWRSVNFNGADFQLIDFALDHRFHAAVAVPGGVVRSLRFFSADERGVELSPHARRRHILEAGATVA